jgi:hypothetical protein
MRRVTALLAALLVVTATLPAGVAAVGAAAEVAQTGTGTVTPTQTTEAQNASSETPTPNATTNDSEALAPGEQLAGVVAVQQSELDGELEYRTFGLRVADAASNDSKADVVAGQLNETRTRLAELRERRAELQTAYDDGNISRGQYRAQTAKLQADINALQRVLNESADVAERLPEDVQRANGIDSESVQRLQTDARNLSGADVSSIAKQIAGKRVGTGIGNETDTFAPGRSGDAPGQRDSGDVNESAANESAVNESTAEDSGAPGRSGDATGNADHSPEKSGEAPGKSGDARDQSGEQPAAAERSALGQTDDETESVEETTTTTDEETTTTTDEETTTTSDD